MADRRTGRYTHCQGPPSTAVTCHHQDDAGPRPMVMVVGVRGPRWLGRSRPLAPQHPVAAHSSSAEEVRGGTRCACACWERQSRARVRRRLMAILRGEEGGGGRGGTGSRLITLCIRSRKPLTDWRESKDGHYYWTCKYSQCYS